MKTATLDSSFDNPFSPQPLTQPSLHRTAAGTTARSPEAAAEPEPVCWRSEAFAEDLAGLIPEASAASAADAAPAVTPRRPLLQRALAAVLRR